MYHNSRFLTGSEFPLCGLCSRAVVRVAVLVPRSAGSFCVSEWHAATALLQRLFHPSPQPARSGWLLTTHTKLTPCPDSTPHVAVGAHQPCPISWQLGHVRPWIACLGISAGQVHGNWANVERGGRVENEDLLVSTLSRNYISGKACI